MTISFGHHVQCYFSIHIYTYLNKLVESQAFFLLSFFFFLWGYSFSFLFRPLKLVCYPFILLVLPFGLIVYEEIET